MTFQLDGLGRKVGDLPPGPTLQEGSDGPVFVDESGRRSKKLRRLGWVLAIVCACYAVALVAALLGGSSSAPWLPGIGRPGGERTDKVEIQPAPSDRASAVVTPGFPPGAPAPTYSTGALLPQPSGGASRGIAGGAPAGLPGSPGPGASAFLSPQPSGGGLPEPGGPVASPSPGGGASDPGPGPAPEGSPPAPVPSDPGPSGSPSEPPLQEGTV
ncbi:hypothetical protein [Streptomyces lunaelactis]|uniref:hypothetical protein n=1 Tax=Streptomyces lunaelactis TaxID=1535768 RepID=UPI001C2FBFFC|nr:hypothetical protein [Streptomyces lunaelactis]